MAEHLNNDVSHDETFGANEALFTYRMAHSLGSPAGKTLSECAEDAVRTAARQHEVSVDIELATQALISTLTADMPQM